MPPAAIQTADDLLRFREPGKTAELVRGVLIVREPPGTGHGVLAARLLYRVAEFVVRHDLGEVIAQDTGFKIERDPDTVRAPDIAFVTRERLPPPTTTGYPALAPDLAAVPADGQIGRCPMPRLKRPPPARREARLARRAAVCGRRS